MKKIVMVSLLLLALTTVQSCKKAGLGGDATIVASPEHHGKPIYGCTVYVKYNTKDAPGAGTSGYDTFFVGDAKEDHVHLEGLNQGNYYLYAVGYDSSISLPVYGGQAIEIKRKDRKEEINLNIAVVE